MKQTHSRIPQVGICRVTLQHKDIDLQCSFFVVPVNGPAFLWMLDYKKLELLTVDCTTVDAQSRQV